MFTLSEVESAGGYSVIYADPAWSYKQAGRGAAVNHYSTMKLADVKALPVARLAAPDCALFLWACYPLLPEALEVGRAWGFEYKTLAFQWVKRNKLSGTPFTGGGFWTRANTEACLLFVKGKPKRVDRSVHQLIEEVETDILDTVIGEHSAKPPVVRSAIEKLMGDVPRIELFTRTRVPGWDAWGNDPSIGESDVSLEV